MRRAARGAVGLSVWIAGVAAAGSGDQCTYPIRVTLPAALPYVDTNTTCGRGDDYRDTCLGLFDDGEDIIYELVVTAPVDVEITLDPRGQAWTALVLDAPCPPGAPTCLAYSASDTGQPHGPGCVPLEPGRYTLMVDCRPTTTWGHCIATFDLTLHACALPRGACCVNGNCVGTLPAANCLAQGGRWYEGFECGVMPCPTLLGTVPETCATAHLLPVPGAVELYTNMAQPAAPAGSCNAPGTALMQNDAWFRHTATGDGRLTLDVRYEYDGLTAIYAGADCLHLSELHCLNSATGVQPDRDRLTFPVVAGTTYWIRVGDYGLNPGGGRTLLVLTADAALRRGDVNCDARVDFGDINPFVMILANPTLWQTTFPQCPFLNGDINGDQQVDFGDIIPFVNLLANP